MVFWIILGIFIVCGLYTLITGPFRYDKFNFKYLAPSSVTTFVFGIIILILLSIISLNRLDESRNRSIHLQEYNSLIYEAKHYGSLQNKCDINKVYILMNIHDYNEKLATYEKRINNPWISIFYGRDLYRQCDYIDLENINME